ncbi:DnrO protein [Rhodanobacter sp. AS-Z3]|uniref:DnrO protein n=1 Tax=Rhodanobacter sp. AS-Z3 TaxID=3031330 RepID=UPI00247AFC4F|nr:DnrO protein [Rhodanobacter sp. AS-Z3]WEN14531.1 DnrO protein [Rhodanobacter sp. AS-Z3]
MKHLRTVLVLACGLGLAVSVQAAPQHTHEHHAAPATTTPAASPAQHWVPDASLREGIRRAYTAVDQLRHYEMGHMSAPMAVDRAVEVEDAVTFMFTHCKLSAEPDEALHGILAPLLGAAQALQSNPKNVKAVAEMREALSHYPHYFNDPGWNNPAPAMQEMHDEP